MPFKIGFGTDLHRLESGAGIPICGVFVECPFAAVAVSDGDAAIHALVDAILGALGEGDIGERYPESEAVRGEPSSRYLRDMKALLSSRNARIGNIDLVIDLQKPALKDYKPAMRQAIADLLGVPSGSINIKAKTGENIGPIGRSEAIAAQAAVLLEIP